MLPWGTPERTGSIAELQPFIETCWTLFVRYSRIHNVWRHFWRKSRGNQREIMKSRTPKLLVADPSHVSSTSPSQ